MILTFTIFSPFKRSIFPQQPPLSNNMSDFYIPPMDTQLFPCIKLQNNPERPSINCS